MSSEDTSSLIPSTRWAENGDSEEIEDEEDLQANLWRFRERERPRRARRSHATAFRDISEDSHGRIVSEVGSSDETTNQMTYRPARFEEVWLRSSLRSFYDQELIVDVLSQVKGGKEANVYCCRAHPRTGADLLAAKVYRPRKFRNLSNDRLYREGRLILTADGRPAKPTDHRIMRALGKKTGFGAQVQHTSWLMHEYTTLQQLRQAGGAVPAPYGANENAILMEYQGDARRPAPALREVNLGAREARRLFEEIMRNVELLLQHGMVHGDLSAYNVLYWKGRVTVIDFPQVTYVHTNRNALTILQRDVRRVCEYFARQGVKSDPIALAESLWERYGVADYGEPDLLIDFDEDLEDEEADRE